MIHLAACLDIKRRAYRHLEQVAPFIPIDLIHHLERGDREGVIIGKLGFLTSRISSLPFADLSAPRG